MKTINAYIIKEETQMETMLPERLECVDSVYIYIPEEKFTFCFDRHMIDGKAVNSIPRFSPISGTKLVFKDWESYKE